MPRSDKGGTHATYDMSLRNTRKMFRDLQNTIDDYAAVQHARREGRPKSERRQAAREALVPADRICPTCGNPVLDLRSWVLSSEPHQCRSCRALKRTRDMFLEELKSA